MKRYVLIAGVNIIIILVIIGIISVIKSTVSQHKIPARLLILIEFSRFIPIWGMGSFSYLCIQLAN